MHVISRNINRLIKLPIRRVIAERCALPEFLVIGAQKSGTSSMYQYLCQHRSIIPPLVKEVHYFDWNYSKGESWYRAHFPFLGKLHEQNAQTFEASPYYLFHPLCARRIREKLGPVRLITILRNPIDRAYSHYQMEVRLGREKQDFEKAIWNDDEMVRQKARVVNGTNGNNRYFSEKSYLQRGNYIEQLDEYFRIFPKENIHVIIFEEFISDGNTIMREVCKFLDIETIDFNVNDTYNRGIYGKMNSVLRDRLREYFKAQNEKLYDLLGRDLGWK